MKQNNGNKPSEHMVPKWRRNDVNATSSRIDVITTSFLRNVPTGERRTLVLGVCNYGYVPLSHLGEHRYENWNNIIMVAERL